MSLLAASHLAAQLRRQSNNTLWLREYFIKIIMNIFVNVE